MMHPEDRAEQVALYEMRLNSVDISDENLSGMGPLRNQEIRHDALLAIGHMRDSRVLDIGCGTGTFYRHAIRRGITGMEYWGIDIVPGLISQANLRCGPGPHFIVGDFLEKGFATFDYVVANGTFNARHRQGDNMAVLRAALSRAFDLANRGVAFTLMSSHVDYMDEYLFYYDPAEVFRYCKGLTRRVTLRHDLPLFEFVIYLFREQPGVAPGLPWE